MGKSLKGKELGRGITQRKDGTYQARFINRFGKRQTIYGKTVTEITKRLRDEQYENEKQINVVNDKMTLDEWFEIWITTCKTHCRNTTKRTYKIQYNRLREKLGWRRLTKLKLVSLQEAFNELATDKMRQDCKALLSDMFKRAIENELMVKNIAIGINPIIENKEKEEKRILSDEEIKILLDSSKSGQMYAFYVIALETGMRMGEILGLTWDCVDFKEGIIDIQKTLCYIPNNGDAIYEFHQTKTKAGKRKIPMTKKVKEVLLEQKKRKNQIIMRHPVAYPGMENLVFCSKTNRPVHESNIRAAIRYRVNKINEENQQIEFKAFTPHCLRHTFATKAIDKGMRPKTLQKILGHNFLQMTMDLYCHVEESTLKTEMALIGEVV